MLGVADVQRSLDFYGRAFGFEERSRFEHGGTLVWARARRDLVDLMFTKVGGPGYEESARVGRATTYFYFYPDDVVDLHATLKSKGFAVSDLRVTVYEMKEFELEDPDGYQLWFGQATNDPPTECE
jgi:uncharacterized glyoxalase superfamily protein PhnB